MDEAPFDPERVVWLAEANSHVDYGPGEADLIGQDFLRSFPQFSHKT